MYMYTHVYIYIYVSKCECNFICMYVYIYIYIYSSQPRSSRSLHDVSKLTGTLTSPPHPKPLRKSRTSGFVTSCLGTVLGTKMASVKLHLKIGCPKFYSGALGPRFLDTPKSCCRRATSQCIISPEVLP